ncbi:hypothetical protein BU23DRAFT_560067 [Bimuria novae-zelandiae CBS 107.79]|uniref:G-patch domain-containing protein n=1 Tax=Bimuria novae-zelandiae CBS 107.79 TaxID=1447943 RepID=A0A6A5UP82_9PLEO|nr:hypothetical protein BU23DRAFT_560067 [Bimuria novae-zelandiae CBS 107.79]
MNAERLLKKQGWRGSGHSLDTTGRGIKKPLLISHKQDQNGLGHKKSAWKTDDQWWMRAFDESLQNLGTGQTSTLAQVQEKGINHGGLYGFFVKGEGLTGTITSEETTPAPTSGQSTPPTSVTSSESEQSDGSGSDSNSASSSSEEPSESSESEALSDSSETAKLKKNQNKKRKLNAADDAPASKKLKQGDGEPKAPVTEITTVLGTTGEDYWPRICAVRKTITRKVMAQTKARERMGVYGLYIATKQARDQKLKYYDDPNNPGKKISLKSAKIERQKNMRIDQKKLSQEMIADAMLKGDLPNHANWSREEILANYTNIEKAIKAIDRAHHELVKQRGKEAKKKRAQAAEVVRRQSIITAQLALLNPEKKANYEARAAEKGQSLGDYILRRVEKNEAKKAEKEAAEKSAKKLAKKAAKEAKKGKGPMFFVDTEGDTAGLVIWTPLEDGTCPIDPSIWEGRTVKDLPKPVREARRKWMEQQRNAR